MFRFDGSELGDFEFFDFIQWIYPLNNPDKTPIFIACTKTGCLVYLKRFHFGNVIQAIVDEIKPLFGLIKMGTHRIKLHGIPKKINLDHPWLYPNGMINFYIHQQWSDYCIFRADVEQNLVVRYRPLNEIKWLPDLEDQIQEIHRNLFKEIQKIFIFRDMLRVSETGLDNILFKYNPYAPNLRIQLLSISEKSIREPDQNYVWLNSTTESFFFPNSVTKGLILMEMFNITSENYQSITLQIRCELLNIITRLSPDHIYIAEYIIDKIWNLLEITFRMLKS